MKIAVVVLFLSCLMGCETLQQLPHANRVVCTVAKDKSFVISEWGPKGISSVIAPEDAELICKP